MSISINLLQRFSFTHSRTVFKNNQLINLIINQMINLLPNRKTPHFPTFQTSKNARISISRTINRQIMKTVEEKSTQNQDFHQQFIHNHQDRENHSMETLQIPFSHLPNSQKNTKISSFKTIFPPLSIQKYTITKPHQKKTRFRHFPISQPTQNPGFHHSKTHHKNTKNN